MQLWWLLTRFMHTVIHMGTHAHANTSKNWHIHGLICCLYRTPRTISLSSHNMIDEVHYNYADSIYLYGNLLYFSLSLHRPYTWAHACVFDYVWEIQVKSNTHFRIVARISSVSTFHISAIMLCSSPATHRHRHHHTNAITTIDFIWIFFILIWKFIK